MSETVATKADLVEVRHEIGLLRSEMKIWTGSLGVVLFMALGGLMTVFKFLVH